MTAPPSGRSTVPAPARGLRTTSPDEVVFLLAPWNPLAYPPADVSVDRVGDIAGVALPSFMSGAATSGEQETM